MASRQPAQRAMRSGAAPRGGVFRFFIEVIAELRRTTWPSRQEATRLTILVLIVAAFFGVFLGAIDYGFGRLAEYLIGAWALTTEQQTVVDEGGRWYIIHTYSGQEDRVKRNLEQRIETMDVKDKIFDVVVPTEEEIEIKDGERRPVAKKMYAGYLLIQMVMDDEAWYVVRNTPGVTGFISAEDERERRPKPVPLEQDEVDRILRQMRAEEPKVRIGFEKGDSVRIVDGPFADFMGTVDSVLEEQGKVRVLVSFFGRETPVELDFLQIQKG